VCPIKRATNQGLIDKKWIENYCLNPPNNRNCKRYQMEEQGMAHSDYMLPDGSFWKNE
jgi:hypothetical protein